MEIMEFIKPELFVTVPVLYVIGIAVKHSQKIPDRFIPLILCAVGVFLSLLYVIATAVLGTWQDVFLAVFVAITQGFLAAGASLLTNQLIKQSKNGD
jgi:hypothetical protein